MNDSSCNDEEEDVHMTPGDVINYYIQPANEYENTVLILYEGYQDPVCVKNKCKEKEQKKQKATDNNDNDDNNDDDYDDDDDDDDDDGHNENIDEDALI